MSISIKILGSQTLPTSTEIEALDFCFCGIDCYDGYVEKAFTGGVSDESWKKDKSSFLFRRVLDSDSVSIEIWKGGAKVADVVDSTYCTFYPSFPNQPLYVGVVIDWSLVASSFGFGLYQIKAVRATVGQSNPFTSRTFHVLPFSEKSANETVRIETYTDGNIISNEFDYQNLIEGGWYQSIRISGRFGDVTPTLIEDRILDARRKVVSVQDSIEQDYTLFTRYLPESVKKQLINQQTLTTETKITDYNLLNDEVIRQLPVVASSFEEVKHASRGTAYVMKFKDRFQNNILRTF
jgi:hypothetical protein